GGLTTRHGGSLAPHVIDWPTCIRPVSYNSINSPHAREPFMSEPAESPPRPVLSIVVPFLNEEEVLEQTYAELKQFLDGLGEPYEMVFVDDGSTDRSRAILAARAAVDPTV